MIVSRYHDISAAHRVVGYSGKCRHLHGHNYRIHFYCEGEINDIGIVIDYADIDVFLCRWLDNNWDHKTILWDQDPLSELDGITEYGVVLVPFNTTAENLAEYLIDVVGPSVLPPNIALTKVIIEETRKCSVTAQMNDYRGRK